MQAGKFRISYRIYIALYFTKDLIDPALFVFVRSRFIDNNF